MEGGDFGRFNHLFVCLFVYCRYSLSFIYFYCYYYTIILFLTNRGSKNDSFLWGQSQSLIGEAKMTHFSGVSRSHSLKRVERRTTTRRLLFGRIKISDYSFKVFRR